MARVTRRRHVMPRLYTGYVPSNVSKDAKYKVSAEGEVHLLYRIDQRTRELLSTSEHADLVEMVNRVKEQINGRPGGAFYINEFGGVLVPGLEGGCYWAGCYEETLEFSFERSVISPVAPPGLEPGDYWPGPHAGVRYKLRAGGLDIVYLLQDGRRSREYRLSDFYPADEAADTAAKISSIKGTHGGRFYINERRELFGPVDGHDGFVYFGHLEDCVWFHPPEGYDWP